MALAPLDAWARLLLAPRARIPLRYWPRLLLNLAFSAIGTLMTLPERLLLWPWLALRARASAGAILHPPGAIVVLGYFRSGTTHLHYLLTCDNRFVTPRWYEALVPQGFVLSWNFLRVFLVAFLSTKRPQDDMAFGPEWPAEDDFALSNWALTSSLPGRVIVPQLHQHYRRFHSLDALSDRELSRWRRYQWAFLYKLTVFAGTRRLLLKTPSHTARVAELLRLFNSKHQSQPTSGRVKFIHLSRDAAPVLKSNVAMMDRMSIYHLQDAPQGGAAEFRRRISGEYDRTEHAFLAQRDQIPPGDLVMMRYEDLIADPLSEMKRAYAALGLEWTQSYERKLLEYLDTVREYRTAGDKQKSAAAISPAAAPPLDPLPGELRWMHEAFGHDRPPRPRATLPVLVTSLSDNEKLRRRRTAYILTPLVAILVAAVWLALAVAINNRSDWVVWLVGAATGYAAMRTAKVGSPRLGLWAALWTVLVWLVVAFAATRFIYYRTNLAPTLWEMWDATQKELRSGSTLPWAIFGVLTAFRFASRQHGGLPGR